MDGGADRESEERKAAILAQFSRADGIKEPEAGPEGATSDDASAWWQKELDLLSKGEGEVVEFMMEFVSARCHRSPDALSAAMRSPASFVELDSYV
jgi:hypothetical protein